MSESSKEDMWYLIEEFMDKDSLKGEDVRERKAKGKGKRKLQNLQCSINHECTLVVS